METYCHFRQETVTQIRKDHLLPRGKTLRECLSIDFWVAKGAADVKAARARLPTSLHSVFAVLKRKERREGTRGREAP